MQTQQHMTADGFRLWGPGRFTLVIDALVYTLSLDGCESVGDVDTIGYASTLVEGPLLGEVGTPDRWQLTGPEERFLAHQVGAIVIEGEQGFVSVFFYDDEDALKDAWEREIEDVEAELGRDGGEDAAIVVEAFDLGGGE